MSDAGRDYELTEFLKNASLQLYREHVELGRQSVQVVTWLVGLSVAMGALLITGLERMPYLGAGAFAAIVGLLALAILAGILHRIVYHYVEGRFLLLMQRLQAQIGGFLIGARGPVTDPSEELRALAQLMEPYTGRSEDEVFRSFTQEEGGRTRREVWVARRVSRFANGLYYFTSAAFMLAVAVLAWNLLSHVLVDRR